MSSSISDQREEMVSTKADNGEPVLEPAQKVNDYLPTPPRSHSVPEEYSDAGSADSQRERKTMHSDELEILQEKSQSEDEHSNASRRRHNRGGRKTKAKASEDVENPQKQSQSEDEQSDVSRRRDQRGGRKTRTKSRRVQTISEIQIPRGLPQEQDEEPDSSPESELEEAGSGDYDMEQLRKAQSSRQRNSNKKQSPPRVPKTATGVKAFNIRRADSSGGSAPLSVTVGRPGSESKSKEDMREKKEKQKTRKKESSAEESEDKEKEQGKKPVQIRLDLNLELEILFTAKIKGDITITFLE